jgi:hypothetical protein
MEKSMPSDTTAATQIDALSQVWELNRDQAGALTLALLLLYQKFTNPLFGRLPDPGSERQAPLEPGTALNAHEDPALAGDSLHLDWLSELPEIPAAPECCSEIVAAIDQLTSAVKAIEACCKPAAEAPTADVNRRVEEMDKELRKLTERGPKEVIRDISKLYKFNEWFLRLSLGWKDLTGSFMALWLAMETAHLDEVLRRFRANPADLKNWSAERREGLEELAEKYPDGTEGEAILEPFFSHGWLEWQRALSKLIENIESPDNDPKAEQLRQESLRVLPNVLDDIHRAMKLFRERHNGQEPGFDDRILDRARDLLQRTSPVDPTRPQPTEEKGSDLLSREDGSRHHAPPYEQDFWTPASYSTDGGRARPGTDSAQQQFERVLDLMESLMNRLREPVRLEVRVLDDRVIARRLDGNRSVDVDLSRGYRMVGYISV